MLSTFARQICNVANKVARPCTSTGGPVWRGLCWPVTKSRRLLERPRKMQTTVLGFDESTKSFPFPHTKKNSPINLGAKEEKAPFFSFLLLPA